MQLSDSLVGPARALAALAFWPVWSREQLSREHRKQGLTLMLPVLGRLGVP